MEFKITKEQILELDNTLLVSAKLKQWFPEAFKTELETGKWYVVKDSARDWLMNYQGKGCVNYGFNTSRVWSNSYVMHNEYNWREATKEEVESALIAEAKKRGYEKGVKCALGYKGKYIRMLESDDFIWDGTNLKVRCNDDSNDIIFNDGIWAEILPTEKTVITREKALKILAKKLKVSPDNIEIE